MQIKRPLLIFAGGFVLGEVLGLQNKTAIGVMIVTVLTAGILTALFALRVSSGNSEYCLLKKESGRSLWLWLLLVFLFAGFWRASQVRMACDQEIALGINGQNRTVTGTVLSRDKREDGSWLVTLGDCNGDGFKLVRLQTCLDGPVIQSGAMPWRIGARVSVTGEIRAFDEVRNPGEFDYQLYGRSQKLNYRMFADDFTVINGGYQQIREKIALFREWAGDILEQIAEPEDCGVYRAAILGDSSRMDAKLRELYQDQGVAHLLAVSGLHLSLISAAVYGGLRKLGVGYGTAGFAGGIVLMLYAVLTGESASVLRALVMGLCGFAASYFGKTYDLMSAWSLALILLSWDSPYRLLQAGVQLSFGALAGIGWLAPRLNEALPVWRNDRENKILLRLLQAFIVSISMQFVTLPILLYHYFQYPVYGIFLNFLMVPLMGGVIASGTAGIFFGAVSLQLGRFALGSGHMILGWYELCCHAAQYLPGNVMIVGRPDWWKIGVYYGILFFVVWWLKAESKKGLKLLFFHCFAICLLMTRIPSADLKVTFLDVGQGDGICIQMGSKTILSDAGSTSQKQLGTYTLVPFFHSRGINQLDYAVVSHGDLDHISGLQYLMESGEVFVETLILPYPGQGEAVYKELVDMAVNQGGRVYWMARGDSLKIESLFQKEELVFTCLSPDKTIKAEDRNEHSLVFCVDYGDFHMLLTGDMTERNEEEILKLYPGEMLSVVQILKAAHHGSNTSTSEAWIQAVRPRWAVISYGEGNRYGHPDEQVIRRLEEQEAVIYETAKCGAIELKTDGKSICWSEFLTEE